MPATPETICQQILLVRCQAGDETAFPELVALYGARLQAFVERLAPPGLAADLLQEIWVAIYRALPGLQDVSRFRAWAFRIARDRVYREFRRRRLRFEDLAEEHLEEPAPREETPPHAEALHEGLAELSPVHREVLHLRYFEDLSYEDIAGLTGSSVGTVRSRLHYARLALKAALHPSPS